jgi:hypothetical protein
LISPWLLPSKSFPINHSSIILSFNTSEYRYWLWLSNL